LLACSVSTVFWLAFTSITPLQGVFVLTLYLLLVLYVWKGVGRSAGLLNKYLSGGIALLPGLLAICHIASVTGLIIASAVPFPFIGIQGIESAAPAFL
jgi:hypothetical protein